MRYAMLFPVALLLLTIVTPRAAGEIAAAQRAEPPRWDDDVVGTFFDDARKRLVGLRPAAQAAASQKVIDHRSADPTVDGLAWSTLVDAETLATEIKRTANSLTGTLASSSHFKTEGHQQCRRDLCWLIVLLGVVDQFDQQVRWQRDAKRMGQYLLQALSDCQGPDDDSFAAVRSAHTLLVDLVRGQSPPESADAHLSPQDELVPRELLMQRMKVSVEEKFSPALSSAKDFRRRSEQVGHESRLLAVLARVIVSEGYDEAADETFVDFARQLGEASAALAEAADQRDYQAARAAGGRLTQSCSGCHEGFRG